jgi:hypothetical protein
MRLIILAGEAMMRTSHRKQNILMLGFLVSLSGAALAQESDQASTLPIFSPTLDTAWVGIGIGAFFEVPGSPTPIVQDPAFSYVSNGRAGRKTNASSMASLPIPRVPLAAPPAFQAST